MKHAFHPQTFNLSSFLLVKYNGGAKDKVFSGPDEGEEKP